jgi:hypothetical protein
MTGDNGGDMKGRNGPSKRASSLSLDESPTTRQGMSRDAAISPVGISGIVGILADP